MSKQYHFAVGYEEGLGFWIDYDVDLNGGNGSVWDTETEQWQHESDEDVIEQANMVNDALYALLETYNEEEVYE